MKAIALAAVLLAAVIPGAAAAAQDDDPPRLKGTLTYARSGGIAGVDDNLTIKRDGKSRLNGRSFRLRKVEREAVAELVAKVDFASVKVEPKPAVPDAFSHELTYRGHKVTFDDPSTPKKLKKLRDLLGRLISKYDET
jgi:hypothetical protein